MNVFANRLREALKMRGISAAELSRRTGINEGTISNYKAGKYVAKQDNLVRISEALGVSIPFLMGGSGAERRKTPRLTVPLLGRIACGDPILAEENVEEFIPLPEGVKADFALKCKGDSMINARILDGDTVYIRLQPTVENGEISAVMIDGEATLKRFYRSGDTVTLMPENPACRPKTFIGEQINNINVIGKAVAFTSIIEGR